MPKLGATPTATEPTAKVVKAVDTETGEVLHDEIVPVQDDPKPAAKKTATKTTTRSAKAPSKVDLTATLDDDPDDHLSILYWGPYGSGKTIDVLSMAKLEQPGKILLANAEGGAKRRALTHHGIDPKRIVPFPPRGEMLTFDGLEQVFFTVAADLARDPQSWLGGVWDSTTAIHDFLLEQVVAADIETKTAIITAANGKRAGNITVRDPFDYETDDYIRMQNQFRSLLRRYRYLPWHFAMTSLVRRDEDKKTHRVTYGPAVSPKLQNDIGGGPDIVIRTAVIKGENGPVWYGRTFPDADESAKDRFHVLPRELVDPTFNRILAYVRGELTEQTDPEQRRMPGGTEPAKKATGKRPAPKTGVSVSESAATHVQAAEAERAAEETAEPPKAAAKRSPTRPSTRTAAKKPAPSELGGSTDNPPF